MGTLANSLFQVMLGWIRTLSSQIWATASPSDNATLLSWIGANWKGLALILCLAGALIDLVIYLIRWQPWRVWRSFFRRLRRADPEDREEPDQEREYAPEVYDSPESAAAVGDSEPVYARRWPARAMDEEPSGRASRRESVLPELMDEETTEPEPDREEPREPEKEDRLVWSRTEPEGTTAAFEQALLPRRRRRVRDLFAEAQEENAPAPEQVIDQYAAYRRPVYPRSWKAGEGEEETT